MRQGVVFGVRLPSCSIVIDREESLLDKSVQTIEVDVREYGTHYSALRRTAERRIEFPFLEISSHEHLTDEPEEPAIMDCLGQYLQQDLVVQTVETRRDISLDELSCILQVDLVLFVRRVVIMDC